MKTVLFAWELGWGAGHLGNIRRMAQRLLRDDIRLVAAVTKLDTIDLLDNVAEVHRLPAWPTPETGGPPSSATMTDNFVAVRMNEPSVVHDMIVAWDRLLTRVNPSLVIADYAPAVSLAARGRIPLMQIGSGYTLPPHDLGRFPPLHDLSPLANRDEVTLDAVNGALGRLALRKLERLPQVFAGDARLVYALPLIDPYVSMRSPAADGPMIDYTPRARNADARDVFVYIAHDTDVRADVLAALRPVARHVRIFAPQLSEGAQHELAQAGAEIMTGHVLLSKALWRCRLAVHLGGSGIANEAVLAGVPQLSLTNHVERYLIGVALERAGIGRLFLAHEPARQLAPDTIEAMYHDEALQQRAAQTAARLRNELPRVSAGDKFVMECQRLLTSG
jgi:UDP:flavonoid glycosyltransferase YjiC (YdhE family)